MKEVDWNAKEHTSPDGMQFDVEYLKASIGQQCTREADKVLPQYDYARSGPPPTKVISADKAEYISNCVQNLRPLYENWMTEDKDQSEAKKILEKINEDVTSAAQDGKKEVVARTLDTKEVPRSFQLATEVLNSKGYQVEIREAKQAEPGTAQKFEFVVKFK